MSHFGPPLAFLRRCNASARVLLLAGTCLWLPLGWVLAADDVPPLAVDVSQAVSQRDLARHVEFLEDPEGRLDVEAVLALPADGWQRTDEFALQLGFSRSVWWVRLRLDNPGPERSRRTLEVDWPLLNELDVHVLEPGQPRRLFQTGDQRAFVSRPLPARTFLFPLETSAGSRQTVLLRLSMRHGIFNAVPLRLWQEADLVDAVQTGNAILGAYFGGIVALLVYNLLLFVSIRDRSFLYYGFYLASLAVWYAGFRGYGYQYLWPDNAWINRQMNLAMPALVHVIATLFVTRFLGLRQRAPTLERWLWALTGLLAIPVGIALADQAGLVAPVAAGFAFYTLLSTLIILAYWLAGFVVMRRGYRPARYYVLAWSCFLLGILVYRATEFPGIGVTPNVLTENSMNFGSTLEFLLLALALGDQYSKLRDDKLAAEQAARAVQREYTARLESQVEARTHELQEAMMQVREALEIERRVQQEQRDFLATVSHELRTPLNVIDVIAQNLQLEAHQAGHQARLDRYEKLQKASDRLSSLLDTYLDEDRFSLLREGPNYCPCDLGALLEDAARAGQVLARGHVISVRQEHPPACFICDPGLVRLVLRTLVDNAVKYTLPGTRVDLSGGGDAEGAWLEVADQGAGLAPGEVERLFDPHFRGLAARGQPGTGLGLSLARRMTEMQGGTLTVNCRPGDGCVFRLWLPARPSTESEST